MKKWIWKILFYLHIDGFATDAHRYIISVYHSLAWYLKSNNKTSPDGLPLPPPHLSFLVTGSYDLGYFYANGATGAKSIQDMLARSNLNIAAFKAVLDFGCGCGRIMRHWYQLDRTKLSGTDYNPILIKWCRSHLKFADFDINGLQAKLDYKDKQFDFIYAYSVFTHLDEPLQHEWIKELMRVLEPGGYLLITLHGKARYFQLNSEQIEAFEHGELVVLRGKRAGTNYCSAYHPESYVRNVLARDLEFVDFVPSMAKDGNQDMYLMRKPIV